MKFLQTIKVEEFKSLLESIPKIKGNAFYRTFSP